VNNMRMAKMKTIIPSGHKLRSVMRCPLLSNMKKHLILRRLALPVVLCALVKLTMTGSASQLDNDWLNPPRDARLRAYWWWINGNVTKEAITRDLEAMKAKGFGGALICDADGSSQDGNARAPHGPTFFSLAWRELFKHALREADRLGLEMSLNIQSGWNLGGPMVPAEDAPKKLVWTETQVTGGTNLSLVLTKPEALDGFYRDLFVLAFPLRPLPTGRKPLQNQAQKALREGLRPFSAPDTAPLFAESAATPDEQDTRADDVLDLTGKLTADGALSWTAPTGEWQVIRFGFTLNDDCRVSTCSEGWDGYALDPFDAGAFQRYWDTVVEPLIADAGPLAGTALKYLHTDSWEVEVANWTPTLRNEFKRRRGYELLSWLPVIAGKIVNSREESNRFLNDFRRTMGDLAVDNHYQLFRDGAHRHGLRIHPESGGPHAVPIDAQQCLGFSDAPMSEFWAWSWRHRIGDGNRFFVKQPASAAHAYGRKLVLAEGFTTIGPHWQETLWDNLKPAFDYACTEGLNLLVWHAFVCSPASEGLPGQQYFAGTHLNPNVTWWEKSAPFFQYINRCQAMLQQGLPAADVAYYYGDHVPNFAQYRRTDPARLGTGYDYDVVTEEVILKRMTVKDGWLTLPEGVRYRLLVLPQRDCISLPVLQRLGEFVHAGATIVGPRPARATSLTDFPRNDAQVQTLADELWNGKPGKGRVIADRTAREVLLAAGVKPDCEFLGEQGSNTNLNFIHRVAGEAQVFFVANRSTIAVKVRAAFRVTGLAPELWDAVSGSRRLAAAFTESSGQTLMPLELPPCGSRFVVFRSKASVPSAAVDTGNTDKFTPLAAVNGPWQVKFDSRWGGPESATFTALVSWPERPELGIKYYSGTAVYAQGFNIPETKAASSGDRIYLDLGDVRELAEVKVNDQSCGITWTPPYRVDITAAVKPGANQLEIAVVNFWPNRIIGDASLPPAQRRTQTNIRKLTADTQLMPSGLLGPVTLLTAEADGLRSVPTHLRP